MLAKYLVVIAVTVLVTVILGVLVLNLLAGEKQITYQVRHDYEIEDPQFLRSMGALLGPPIISGKRVDTLLNGDQVFPAMLDAIRAASRTITFETYIYWSGDIGGAFAQALAERAKNGVKVYQPTMFHCKVLVVDGLWTSGGSTNFDNRSFRLNDEANLNVYDAEFAAQQIAIFNDDLEQSRRVTYE